MQKLEPNEWRLFSRTQLSDNILEDIKNNPDPQMHGYSGMADRTGIPVDVIKDLKPMWRGRAKWKYPKYQLDWDYTIQSYRLINRVDVIRTKTLVTHGKTAGTHLRAIADIERLNHLTQAHQVAARMAKRMAENCEDIQELLSAPDHVAHLIATDISVS
jgi:hypothetical protein